MYVKLCVDKMLDANLEIRSFVQNCESNTLKWYLIFVCIHKKVNWTKTVFSKYLLLFFQLTICCENQSFRIVVNGTQMHNFKHRFFPLQQISILEIEGDVSLTSVMV